MPLPNSLVPDTYAQPPQTGLAHDPEPFHPDPAVVRTFHRRALACEEELPSHTPWGSTSVASTPPASPETAATA